MKTKFIGLLLIYLLLITNILNAQITCENQNYSKNFTSLSKPLFEAKCTFNFLYKIDNTKNIFENYIKNAKEVQDFGLNNIENKNEYLKKLRYLDKEYKKLIYKIKFLLRESIKEKQEGLFLLIMESKADKYFLDSRLEKKVIDFYETTMIKSEYLSELKLRILKNKAQLVEGNLHASKVIKQNTRVNKTIQQYSATGKVTIYLKKINSKQSTLNLYELSIKSPANRGPFQGISDIELQCIGAKGGGGGLMKNWGNTGFIIKAKPYGYSLGYINTSSNDIISSKTAILKTGCSGKLSLKQSQSTTAKILFKSGETNNFNIVNN